MYMSNTPLLGTAAVAATASGAAAQASLTNGAAAAGVGTAPVQHLMGPGQQVVGPATAGSGGVEAAAPPAAPAELAAQVAQTAEVLPFTGVNVFFLLLAAITLLMSGAALIRIGRTLATPAAA